MDLKDKTVAITGGARGIGRAMAEEAKSRGAKVAVADLEGAPEAGQALGGFGVRCDVTDEGQVARFITEVEHRLGPIALFISNAGILAIDGPGWGAASAPNAVWERTWAVNVMGSVYAARHIAEPLADRNGAFMIVASAAGLLAQIGGAPYTVTKHAAVAFAECLAITHGDDGLQVVCVCPQAVDTEMVRGASDGAGGTAGMDGVAKPEDVAREAFVALDEKRFFALPHPKVADYVKMKAENEDRWLGGMRKVRRSMIERFGRPV